MTKKVKQLPMGIADFQRLRTQEYYYVDKTMYIPSMEDAGSYLFLVRPRRFGKSLFLSMLEAYYDCKQARDFDKLFGGLWIHDHPTEQHARFQVLRLDFSQVTGSIDVLEERFNNYCDQQLNSFANRYADYYAPGYVEKVASIRDAISKLSFVCTAARDKGYPLYLIVDEYDNFTNTVLSLHGNEIYKGLTHGERLRVGEQSSGMGFYRGVFKIFKPNFERILMLGVSPVTLDDLTSGYNIATNITAEYPFNLMLGLSETEVRQMLSYYLQTGSISGDIEAMIEEMRPWYDNYCFSPDALERDPKVYNTYMVINYVRTRMVTGRCPEQMFVPNTGIDIQSLCRLFEFDSYAYRRVFQELTRNGCIDYSLLNQCYAGQSAHDYCLDQLYYNGLITITGRRGASLRMAIPNRSIYAQFVSLSSLKHGRSHKAAPHCDAV